MYNIVNIVILIILIYLILIQKSFVMMSMNYVFSNIISLYPSIYNEIVDGNNNLLLNKLNINYEYDDMILIMMNCIDIYNNELIDKFIHLIH